MKTANRNISPNMLKWIHSLWQTGQRDIQRIVKYSMGFPWIKSRMWCCFLIFKLVLICCYCWFFAPWFWLVFGFRMQREVCFAFCFVLFIYLFDRLPVQIIQFSFRPVASIVLFSFFDKIPYQNIPDGLIEQTWWIFNQMSTYQVIHIVCIIVESAHKHT